MKQDQPSEAPCFARRPPHLRTHQTGPTVSAPANPASRRVSREATAEGAKANIRSEKKHEDIIEDAKEKMPGSGAAEVPLPAAGTRKPRAKRPPQIAEDEQAVKALEFRSAEVLRLMPPHSLEQAELNYRHLIKTVHPDPNNADEGATEKAATLNEAIEYFRRTLGG